MKRTLTVLVLCLAGSALPARADPVVLAPAFESSYTNVGCSAYNGGAHFGEQTHITEPSLSGRIRNGVSLSSGVARGVDDGVVPAFGKCESVSRLSVLDELASGTVPSYTATFTVREASGARLSPVPDVPHPPSPAPDGPHDAAGEFLVMALLRVTDPRCGGTTYGALPAVLADASGALAPGTVFSLSVGTPAACARPRATALDVQVSLYARVAMSDRRVAPVTGTIYDAPGFGSASALADVDVVLTRSL